MNHGECEGVIDMNVKRVRCRSCPFVEVGQVLHEGGTATPYYRHPSLFCGAADDALIVDPNKKPPFCPLPMCLDWLAAL